VTGVPPHLHLIIAIDGPVAAGKSTVARLLAQRLGYCHIDSGAMYRALAWKARKAGVDLTDEKALLMLLERTALSLTSSGEELRVWVDGEDVTEQLRSPDIDAASSIVSTHPLVRKQMVERQREMGAGGGVIMDGRDIGTVVFPQAPVKFYLAAAVEERGRRRLRQTPGDAGTLEATIEEVKARDRRDMERSASPLQPAPDAIWIDTTSVTPEEVVERMLDHIRRTCRTAADFFLA
jgi:cytidylate kinase